jgi:hypothetical protein
MKKTILILTILAGTIAAQAQNTKPAIVEQTGKYYLFVDSRPADKYEVLGEVKILFTWTGKNKELKKRFAKNAARKFPNGNGLIWHTTTGEATVIKLD